MYRILCAALVYFHQRINVIQRIEQEMRVELTLQVFKFGACPLALYLFFLVFGTIPVRCHFYSHRQPYGEQEKHHIPRHEKHRRQVERASRLSPARLIGC